MPQTAPPRPNGPATGLLLCLVLAALTPSLAWAEESADEQATRVLVLDFTATGIDENTAAMVGRVVASELARRSTLQVLSADDVRRALALEGEKQTLDCTTESCLGEIAGALGARLVVFGDVGALGDDVVVTLTLFDAHQAATRHRVSRAMSPERTSAEARVAAAEIASVLSPQPPLWLMGGVTTLVVGGLAAGVGGAALGAALWTRGRATSTGAEKELAANVLLPAGAIAIAGTLVAAAGAVIAVGSTVME